MGKFDIKLIDKILDKMLAFDATGDENAKNDFVKNNKNVFNIVVDNWSFSELDQLFEEGIKENGTFLSDEMYYVAVGYALITRYNLKYDEYIEWSKNQNEEYVFFLLKLIGIDDSKYKEIQLQKTVEKKCARQREFIDTLSRKKKIISFSETETGYVLFGKEVVFNPIAEKITELAKEIREGEIFGNSVFDNEFSIKCKDYKEASANIASVLNDTIEAIWVNCKRFLRKSGIAVEIITDIQKKYFEKTDVSFISEELDNAYGQLFSMLENEAQNLSERDMNRRSYSFSGGGFGVLGAAKGMIAASLIDKVYDSLNTGMTKGSVSRLKGEFEKLANDIYIGKDTLNIYKEFISNAADELKTICIDKLFPNEIEKQSNSSFADIMDMEMIKELPGDEQRKLASELIFVYPYCVDGYCFAADNFIGIKDEVVAIAKIFGVDDELRTKLCETASTSIRKRYNYGKMSYNDNCKYCTYEEALSVLQEDKKREVIQYKKENKSSLDLPFSIIFRKRLKALLRNSKFKHFLLCEYGYSILDENIYPFLCAENLRGDYIIYYSNNVVVTDNVIIFRKSKNNEKIQIRNVLEIIPVTSCSIGAIPRLIVRLVRGGMKKVSIPEEKKEEYLFIADAINISLDGMISKKTVRYYRKAQGKDRSQLIFCEKCKKVVLPKTERTLILNHILCGNCNAESKYVNKIIKDEQFKHLDDNVDKKIALCETEGIYKDEEQDIELYGIENFVLEDNCAAEQEINKDIVEKYVIAMAGKLDFKSAMLYRILMRFLLKKYTDKEQIVNLYAYQFQLPPETLCLEKFAEANQLVQYILYSDTRLIITDFKIYFIANNQKYNYSWDELIEILPMEEYYGSTFVGICVHTAGGKFRFIEDSNLNRYSQIFDLINIVLEESSKIKKKQPHERFYNNYYTQHNERYIYCKSCRKWGCAHTQEGSLINRIYCDNCYSSLFKACSKIKNENIPALKNDLSNTISNDIDKYIAQEIINDKETGGILELGIKLQKEVPTEEQGTDKNGKAETEKCINKVQIDHDWRYAQFSQEDVDEFRYRFIKAITGTPLQKYVVNQAISDITDPILADKMKYMKQILNDQIVLYHNGTVIITDHYIVWGNLVKEIEDIQEIVWFTLESNHALSKILIKTKNTNCRFSCGDEGQDSLISLIINVSLDGIRDKNYITEFDKNVCYCGKCGSRDVVIKGIFNSKCNKCGNSYTGNLYRIYWKEAGIVERIRAKLNTPVVEGLSNRKTNVNPMIFCTHCGKKIARSSKFCTFCGAKNTYRREGEKL